MQFNYFCSETHFKMNGAVPLEVEQFLLGRYPIRKNAIKLGNSDTIGSRLVSNNCENMAIVCNVYSSSITGVLEIQQESRH